MVPRVAQPIFFVSAVVNLAFVNSGLIVALTKNSEEHEVVNKITIRTREGFELISDSDRGA